MYLVTANEMQEMDRKTIQKFGLPGRVLMENAGKGAAHIFLKQFNDAFIRNVGVMAGYGNNGGDGFVIARYLAQKGVRVTVFLLAEKRRVKGDAANNLQLLAPLDVSIIELPDQTSFSKHTGAMRHHTIWIDAIFGTGLKSDVKGYFKQIIGFINSLNKPVFSVDIPSGLDSDTGQPCGASIRAHTTATFAFPKIGHLLYPGADYTGKLEVIDIGIPPYIANEVAPRQYLLTTDLIQSYFQPRSSDAHKGKTGHLLVIAGSPGKTGAATMAALSAMRVGAGLVTLGVPRSSNLACEIEAPEIMTCPLPETKTGVLDESSYDPIVDLLSGKKCLAIGPGLGTSAETGNLVSRVIQKSLVPVVIDADGLNHLAPKIEALTNVKADIILTPHPGEMARLMKNTPDAVQRDRINCARSFAEKWGVHVVLKGARSVIAHPKGQVFVNPTGNSGMASGGMGDVLTGLIAGLVTQGYPPESACCLAVFLHGAAADSLKEEKGPIGYLATDVMDQVPTQMRDLMVQV